jgi:hypothetical protein
MCVLSGRFTLVKISRSMKGPITEEKKNLHGLRYELNEFDSESDYAA